MISRVRQGVVPVEDFESGVMIGLMWCRGSVLRESNFWPAFKDARGPLTIPALRQVIDCIEVC